MKGERALYRCVARFGRVGGGLRLCVYMWAGIGNVHQRRLQIKWENCRFFMVMMTVYMCVRYTYILNHIQQNIQTAYYIRYLYIEIYVCVYILLYKFMCMW